MTTIHNIINIWLKDYCENREEWLKRVIINWKLDEHPNVIDKKVKAREIAKNLFIVLSYGGGIDRWRNNWRITKNIIYEIPNQPISDEVENYKKEMSEIHKKIRIANPHLTQQIIENKTAQGKVEGSYNLNGSVASYYLQEYECRILETIYQYCLQKEYIKKGEVMLCADGIILSKQLFHEGIPAELERIITEKTGFNLKIEKKPMDNGYTPAEIKKALDFDIMNNTFTTGFIGDVFSVLYSDKFIFTEGTLRTYNGVYWKGESDKKHSTLHNWIDSTFHQYLDTIVSKKIYEINCKINEIEPNSEAGEKAIKSLKERRETYKNKQKDVEAHCRNIRKRTAIVDDVINKINNPDIVWDDHPYLLTFNNKIYDLKHDEWISPDYQFYISLTTGYDWNTYELDVKKAILIKLIDSIFPDKKIRDYYLTILSTGLCGIPEEHLFIATGGGGNGKSLLNGLMLEAMGKYGYIMPNWILQEKKGAGACPEMANVCYKRYVLTSEPDKDKAINTSTLKEITGGLKMNARTIFKEAPEGGIKIHASYVLEANKLPILDDLGDSIGRRIDVIPFQSRFCNENDYNKYLETQTKAELAEKYIYLGNVLYKTDEWKRGYTHALISILMDYYSLYRKNGYTLGKTPRECEIAKAVYFQSSDNLYGWFESEYVLATAENPEEIVSISKIYTQYKESNYFNKLTRKAQNESTKKKFTNEIFESINLRAYMRKRDEYYKKILQRSDTLVGWRKLTNKDKESDEVDDDLGHAEEK